MNTIKKRWGKPAGGRWAKVRGLASGVLLLLFAASSLAAPQDPPQSGGDTRPPVVTIRGEFEKICRDLTQSDNLYYGTKQVEQLEQMLGATTDPRRSIELKKKLAQDKLRLGDNVESLQLLLEALRLAATNKFEAKLQIQLLMELGVSSLRIGEVINCVRKHTPDMCIMPIEEAGQHSDPRAALDAMNAFQNVLEGVPGYIPSQWLLNIAAMTVGRYPEGVKEEDRIPPENMTSEFDIGRFRDVAGKAGLHIFGTAGGALVDDFDGDGLLDIVTSAVYPCSPMRYFRNDGRGGFEDRSQASGLDQQLGGLNLVHADYNNDGHLDILVLRGGWLANQGRMRNSLLRNQGDGTFSDVTHALGLAEPAYPTQTAAWADFDLDGDLDLYVGNEGGIRAGSSPTLLSSAEDALDSHPSQLFRNDLKNGKEGFTDIAEAAGVTNLVWAKGVAWGDFDGDRDPDLYVSNIGPNRLYRNDGGTFTDIAAPLNITEPAIRSFATWFFDFDNDGDLDLFVTDYNAKGTDVARHYLGLDPIRSGGHVRLYRNEGGGKSFTDVSEAMGLAVPSLPMGANFGDLDNDGFLDIYLGTGTPSYHDLTPNLMYRNDRGTRFVDVTFSGGFGHLQKGHGVAFADVDHDGDQDVFEQMGGAFPGDTYQSVLYENPGHGHGWVHIKLEGRTSNRAAIGTRLKVDIESLSGPRSIYHHVGSGGSFGGSPLRAEVGLGDAKVIRRLEVYWPASDTRQVFKKVAINGSYRLVEGGELERVTLPRLELGRNRPSPPTHPHHGAGAPGTDDPSAGAKPE